MIRSIIVWIWPIGFEAALATKSLILSDMFTVIAVLPAWGVHPKNEVSDRYDPRHPCDGIEQEFDHRSGRRQNDDGCAHNQEYIDGNDRQKHERADQFFQTHPHDGV